MAGIYLHIPFCVRRCIYCDFYSVTRLRLIPHYVQALTNEIRLRASWLNLPDGTPSPINTIYFGGGTPSLLPFDAITKILETIFSTYKVSSQAEITLEANPDDLSPEYITLLRHSPVNRLSIGIQTLDNNLLHYLHRRHTAQQAINAVRNCQNAGFTNLSIDLIYGIPGQTLQDFQADVADILSLRVPHISAYSLTFEPGTPLWQMRARKRAHETDEELSLNMYNRLIDKLSAQGYEHYEISNFALPGFRSRHNSSYWRGTPYLGCGPAAHSFNGRRRQWNTADLSTYISKVSKCSAPEDFENGDWTEGETLNTFERYNERIVTALRTCEGTNIRALYDDFGKQLGDYCLHSAEPHLKNGLLEITNKAAAQGSPRLRLTRKGLFLSDGIISDLFYVQD